MIQVFAPGIPQVYYVGFLAGRNDLELLEQTKEGRNINRHYYTSEEIAEEVKRPVVKALIQLFTFRNQSQAFDLEGNIKIEEIDANTLLITRCNQEKSVIAEAKINIKDLTYEVKENGQLVSFL